MKKLAIFDLDGTLLNTISDLGKACNYALEKMGFATHPIQAYAYMVGNGVRNLMKRAQQDADEETIDKMLEYFKSYYNEHCLDTTKPYPGILELLENLKNQGVALAVASNKYQEATDKIISGCFPQFDFVAVEGQKEGRHRKPDPSIIFSILEKYPVAKKEVLYIGDSGVDIECAKRACVESIGVSWGFRSAAELRMANADFVVTRPAEILDHLQDPF
ncbi:MAG: HAD-IA family hydrolase [Muribaculaceae bacterium]|nr:HAD-IA family hydrolase [Muribaculaceae bacterium]